MPKGFTFGSRRELGETLNLDFLASRPPPGPPPKRAAQAPAGEERPLYLDPAERDAPPGQPGTYHGFAGDPAVAYLSRDRRPARGARRGRWLLAVGLAAVAAASVAAAFFSYPAVERRILAARTAPAEPAPLATVADSPAPAAEKPVVEVQEAKIPAPLDAAAVTPAPKLPQAAPVAEAEPAPEVAEAKPHAPPKARRPQRRGPGPEASVATARANIDEAFAPASTLSAQLAGRAPSAGE